MLPLYFINLLPFPIDGTKLLFNRGNKISKRLRLLEQSLDGSLFEGIFPQNKMRKENQKATSQPKHKKLCA